MANTVKSPEQPEAIIIIKQATTRTKITVNFPQTRENRSRTRDSYSFINAIRTSLVTYENYFRFVKMRQCELPNRRKLEMRTFYTFVNIKENNSYFHTITLQV